MALPYYGAGTSGSSRALYVPNGAYTPGATVTPLAGQGTVVDSSGSPYHLPPGYFNQGTSVQGMGGSTGLGTPGVPSSSGCAPCDWVSNNILWVVLGIIAAVFLFLFVLR